MPGERAWRTQQAQQANGIPVPEPVAADLRKLAHQLGVALPPALAAHSAPVATTETSTTAPATAA